MFEAGPCFGMFAVMPGVMRVEYPAGDPALSGMSRMESISRAVVRSYPCRTLESAIKLVERFHEPKGSWPRVLTRGNFLLLPFLAFCYYRVRFAGGA